MPSTTIPLDMGSGGAHLTPSSIAPTLYTLLKEHKDRLDLLETAGTGDAVTIGILDAGAFTAATTVEAALAEIYQHLKSAQGTVVIPITSFRESDANGDVGNIVANGGVLASDTTPILRATNKALEIVWAAGNADPIIVQVSLPAEFDGSADVLIDLYVQTDNAGGGGIDAATFTVETSWDGVAAVSDTATDGTPAVTLHKITATVAAADVPNSAANLSILLTPAAHAADPVELHGIRVTYKKTILTS